MLELHAKFQPHDLSERADMPAGNVKSRPNPFAKNLASSNRKSRDRALSSLRIFLREHDDFTLLDFLKLWKGLFYCMWMSDKPRTQQQLARDLADLVDVLRGQQNILGFLGAFWQTIAREWIGIDALRMDKYFYLVRCYVRKGFECVRKKRWGDEELLDEYLKTLMAVPLNARDARIPNGLRYHVIEIYVDELRKVDTDRNAPLERIMAPLRRIEKNAVTKHLRVVARDALQDKRLENWRGESATDGDASEVGQTPSAADDNESEHDDETEHDNIEYVDETERSDDFSGFDD